MRATASHHLLQFSQAGVVRQGAATEQKQKGQADFHRQRYGKRADIVIRSTDMPDAQPNVAPIKQLMLVSRTKGVDTVLCNGEVLVRRGNLTRLDEAEVYAMGRASAKRMAERAGIKVKSKWPVVVR